MLDAESFENAKILASQIVKVTNPKFSEGLIEVIVEFTNSNPYTMENQKKLNKVVSDYIAALPPEAFTE